MGSKCTCDLKFKGQGKGKNRFFIHTRSTVDRFTSNQESKTEITNGHIVERSNVFHVPAEMVRFCDNENCPIAGRMSQWPRGLAVYQATSLRLIIFVCYSGNKNVCVMMVNFRPSRISFLVMSGSSPSII